MRYVLSNCEDFLNEVSALESILLIAACLHAATG